MSTRPIIGISVDVAEVGPAKRLRAECSLAYADAVTRAGGLPIYLPPIVEDAAAHAELADGFVLTGGNDPRMEPFGGVTHPAATPMHDRRQAYEVALLRELEKRRPPTLGVCLGMQMMAITSGGTLEQHLPDRLGTDAARHRTDGGLGTHEISLDDAAARAIGLDPGHAAGGSGVRGWGCSHHHQAVAAVGPGMEIIARDADGTVEAIRRAGATFWVGVQWHPERTSDPILGQGIFDALVRAARPHPPTPH